MRVLNSRRENRVSEPRVPAVQSNDASHPRHHEANLFDPPPTDLRDYLTKKRSTNRITSSCCCERLITMLSKCRCSSGANQQSLVRQLTLIPRSAKRSRSHRRRIFSDTEYPELTANMASRSRGKQPAVSFDDESDAEPVGVYRHTRTRTGAIPPIDYNALTRGIEVNDSHFAIAESQASNSSMEKEAFISVSYTHLTLPTIYSV